MKPKAIDLFCGAGGMSEGIIKAGFDIVYSNDINEQVKETYIRRHEQLGIKEGVDTHFECADIRELNGEDILFKINNLEKYKKNPIQEIDAIFGGPPCQGFSRAGLRDKNDPRNMLFKEYVRIISETKPKYVVMENVEGMMDTKLENFVGVNGDIYKGEFLVLEILKKEFQRIDYDFLEPRVLKANEYGVPQKRKRLIFLGFRKDMEEPTYPKKEEKEVTVKEALEGLNGDKIKSEYAKKINKKEKNIRNTETSKHDDLIKERFSLFQQGETQKQTRERITMYGIDLKGKEKLIELLKEKRHNHLTNEKIIEIMKNSPLEKEDVDILLTKKNSRTRLHGERPSPTILTSSDDYIHPYENRSLSVREMARLQSFDDDFVFYGKRTTGGKLRKSETPQMTQVGNAVPPILAEKIAKEIYNKTIKK